MRVTSRVAMYQSATSPSVVRAVFAGSSIYTWSAVGIALAMPAGASSELVGRQATRLSAQAEARRGFIMASLYSSPRTSPRDAISRAYGVGFCDGRVAAPGAVGGDDTVGRTVS
jgi:hypothetical protein